MTFTAAFNWACACIPARARAAARFWMSGSAVAVLGMSEGDGAGRQTGAMRGRRSGIGRIRGAVGPALGRCHMVCVFILFLH